MAVRISIKRGNTFAVQGQVSGLDANGITGWEIKSQVRYGHKLIADLTVTVMDTLNGIYQLTCADTTQWPVAVMLADICYTTASGQVVSTETFEIECKSGVTE